MKTAAVGVAGVFAIKELSDFVKGHIEAANEVAIFAARLNTSTQQVQEFQAIAQTTGLQMNFFQHSFRTLAFQVAQNKAEFAELGVKTHDAGGKTKSVTDLFWEVGEALGNVKDETRRAYLAQTLLGRSAQQLMPIFQGSKEEIEAFRKKVQETSEVYSEAFINKSRKSAFELGVLDRMWRKVGGLFAEQLLPLWDKTVDLLERLATWTKEWVDRGEAMNSFIAAAIVAIGALTAALAPLAVSAIAAAAPFIGLFLVLDDLVTFMKGGKSIIGEFANSLFGAGGDTQLRNTIGQLWDTLKAFAAWIADPTNDTWQTFYESAKVWLGRLVGLVEATIQEISKFIKDDPILGPMAALIEATTARPEVPTEQKGLLQMTPGEAASYAANSVSGWFGKTGAPDSAPSVPTAGVLDRMYDFSGGSSPQVTNNITVQGNATPQTAREIATQTGRATADALGRDRSAVGAAMGIRQ